MRPGGSLGLAVIAIALLAAPADAVLRTYRISGDQSLDTPPTGPAFHPGVLSGRAVIRDDGNGLPVLVALELAYDFTTDVFQLTAPVTGSFELRWQAELGVAPDQSGTGSVGTAIGWGALTGWTQTGVLDCQTLTSAHGGSVCTQLGVAEGPGPLPPLEATAFDSDPWTFEPDASGFVAQAIRIVALPDPGNPLTTQHLVWRGTLEPPVPALPGAGLALCALVLAAVGAHKLRRAARV